MTHRSLLGWLYRLMFLAAILIALVLFLVLPVAGSFLITNNHFHFPERGAVGGFQVTVPCPSSSWFMG